MTKVICDIYKSPKKEGLYVYVDKLKGLTRLPEALLTYFGEPQLALSLVLEPTRKLANADIDVVLKDIAEKGFYLQMPTNEEMDEYMLEISKKNSKLSGVAH